MGTKIHMGTFTYSDVEEICSCKLSECIGNIQGNWQFVSVDTTDSVETHYLSSSDEMENYIQLR